MTKTFVSPPSNLAPFPGQMLIITRGLPASGKSTWARMMLRQNPNKRVVVEKDQLRTMLGGGFVKDNEYLVHKTSVNLTRQYLSDGMTVIVPDTNLPNRSVKSYMEIAAELDVNVWVVDFTNVSLGVCHTRNQSRRVNYEMLSHPDDRDVPDEVIEDMHRRFVKGKNYPLPLPEVPSKDLLKWEQYVPRAGSHSAILVDIDGTVALMNGRSPYDWKRVSEDTINESVVNYLRYVQAWSRTKIVLMSGRDEVCRELTEQWLDDNDIPYNHLYMRSEGDTRRDDLVKYELFNDYVRNRFNVVCVLDDRDQVVRMWRAMGLSCWQVNYGDF